MESKLAILGVRLVSNWTSYVQRPNFQLLLSPVKGLVFSCSKRCFSSTFYKVIILSSYINYPHTGNTYNNQIPYEDHFLFTLSQGTDLPVQFAFPHLSSAVSVAANTRPDSRLFNSQISNSQSCLKDALHIYHPLLAELELLPHLLNLDVITLHKDLGYVPIIR